MNKIVKGSVLLAAIALTACSGSSSSNNGPQAVVNADGSCTEATVNQKNALAANAKTYTKNPYDQATLKKLAQSCLDFKSYMGTQSCKAYEQDTYAYVNVSWSSVEKECNEIIKIAGMSTGGSSDNKSTTTPAPSTPPRNVGVVNTALTKDRELSIQVLSNNFVYAFSDIAETENPTVTQKGRYTKDLQSLDIYSPYCVIGGSKSLGYVGSVIKVKVYGSGRNLTLASADASFVMSCTGQYKSSWHLNDLKDVLGNLAEISAK